MNTTVSELPQPKSANFEWSALKTLLPYLWPAGGLEMRVRVSIAIAFLIGAKVATVYVPILFKRMVDLFSDPANSARSRCRSGSSSATASCASPRSRSPSFATPCSRRLRSARSARSRCRTFRHLHSAVALRFHLERQTGGLSRAIERGTTGIDTLLYVHAVQHRADADRDRARLRDPLGVLQHLVRVVTFVCAWSPTSRTRCS